MFRFEKRRQHVELARALRRVADTTAAPMLLDEDPRCESRQCRVFPAFLAPWENGTACCAECSFAVTKNISDRGLSLILSQPFHADQVVIGLWPTPFEQPGARSEPLFILGELRQNVEIGGGFWQLCLGLNQLLTDRNQTDRLMPFAARLIPSANADLAAIDQALCASLRH